jgi:hypothetical protein
MFYELPQEILNNIYIYDITYRIKYDLVLKELLNNIEFIWKVNEQNKYYNVVCNNYIRKLFQFLKTNKEYIFYLDYDSPPNRQQIIKYLREDKPIEVSDFYKDKVFQHYKTFPIQKYNNIPLHDVDDKNVAFTVEDYEEMTEKDLKCESSGCHQCEVKYGGGICFTGKTYNTGLIGDEMIEYDGYIKTYSFNRCNCFKDENDNIIKEFKVEDNEFPFVEIRCGPVHPNIWNIGFLNNCILFDIKICKIPLL